jgi:hypothetical protein
MSGKKAGLAFLGVCFVLAVLLFAKAITLVLGGCLYALALVTFGILSRGFTRD